MKVDKRLTPARKRSGEKFREVLETAQWEDIDREALKNYLMNLGGDIRDVYERRGKLIGNITFLPFAAGMISAGSLDNLDFLDLWGRPNEYASETGLFGLGVTASYF